MYSGPRFVASDLSDDLDGDQKYSVQSFLVTPEELLLLKPTHTWTTSPHANGQLTIDAKMLRQLSEAGMTIGRQIETSAVDYVLQSTKDAQTVKRFATKFAVSDNEHAQVLENIFEKIKSIVNDIQEKTERGVILLSSTASQMTNGCNGNGNGNAHQFDLIQILSSTIMDCVISTRNANAEQQSNKSLLKFKCANSSLYELISQALEDKLGDEYYCDDEDADEVCADSRRRNMTDVVRVIGQLLASPIALEQLERRVDQMVKRTIKISKVDLIASTISKNIYNDTEILNNVCAILHGENEDDMIEAVHELYECDPKILYRIVANIKLDATKLATDDDAVAIETVKNSVIAAVKESAANEIKQIRADDDYLLDTVALAKALGLTDVAQNLLNVMRSGGDVIGKLQQDNNVMDLIERVVVMHKLAKNKRPQCEALRVLRSDPYGARKVPTIREMLRRSGICTIRPMAKSKLSDSNEVPISLFCSENQLAMEDFLMRRQTKSRGAFLIVKEGLQAVVPRECSRDVLTGKCAYTVLDENGIRHFEPLHVFSALKLNLPSLTHRFSMYSCDMVANGDDVDELKGVAATTKATTTAANTELFKGLTLTNGRDKSTYLPSLNYTSSFNKRRRPHRDLSFNGNQVNKRHSHYF